jgi:sulfur-oxidizing protein SoxB
MISRRDFVVAAGAVAAMAGSMGLGPLTKVAAQQRLTEHAIAEFASLGSLTILHVTDLHAQLLPLYFREPSINIGIGEARNKPPHLTGAAFLSHYGIAPDSPDAYALTSENFSALARAYGRMGGIDRIATLIRHIRAERGASNVLLLDGGDTWQGSWTALKTGSQDMIEVMSALRVDAMTGHWEFTLGQDRVKAAIASAPFAFLAQNVRDLEWKEPVFPSRRNFERGGVQIAVIGQAFPRTPVANPRWMMPDWEFGIRESELQQEVDAARRDGAAVVILLSHNGFDLDQKLAARVNGIDLILTAHTHDALPRLVRVGSTALAASGSHGKFLSRIDMELKAGRVADLRFKLMPVFTDAIAPDRDMKMLVEKIRGPFEAELARELGRTEGLLYRRGNFNGTFDDLLCQAMLRERDVEIALSPGFRWGGSLLPGDAITFESLTNATAITYPACYRTTMTGAQIKSMLEEVADNIFHADPFFQAGGDMVRVGGLGYAIDVSKPLGQRISDLTLQRDQSRIDASRGYSVAGWASVNPELSGPPIWTVAEKYLSAHPTVRLETNNNVKITGA